VPRMRAALHAAAPGSYEFFLARTAYLDQKVARALREGLSQLVVLGAGFDTRPYRFASILEGCRVFELDGRATQDRKRELLAKEGVQPPPGLTYVAVDFTRDRLQDVLPSAGYRPGSGSLFIWEGVTYYLPQSAVDETLRFVRQHAPPGSAICFDYMLPQAGDAGRYGAAETRALMQAAYTSEPLLFALAPDDVARFLAERGFRVIRHLATADLEELYFTRPDGTLAARVLDLFGLVEAAVVASQCPVP
jgi:methyltransferase (TIGR00027 family)